MKLKFGLLAFVLLGCGRYDYEDDCYPGNTADYCFEDRTVLHTSILYTPSHVPYFVPTYTTEHVHVTNNYHSNTIKTVRKNRSGTTTVSNGPRKNSWTFKGSKSNKGSLSTPRPSSRPSRSFGGRVSRGGFGRRGR